MSPSSATTLAVLFSLLLLHPLSAADSDSPATPSAARTPKAYPPGVRSLEVFRDADRLHLLLGSFSSDSAPPLLTHQSSTDWGKTWSEPVQVNVPGVLNPHGLHRGVDARIAASGSLIVAAWSGAGSDKWGSGPIVTVLSQDAGKTWRPGPNPADDGRTDGHNFLALGTDSLGKFHLAWLDSRDGERGLRYSVSRDGGGSWASNSTAAPKTCECCWNALAPLDQGGIAILYRARTPRDMHVVTSPNGGAQWNQPVPVGNFQWDLNVCPHVGGALATCPGPQGQRLHATVWTGAAGKSGLYHLRSDDAGQSWSSPHKMNVPMAWHPHLAADRFGRVAAVWDTMTASTPVVWGCLSTDAGNTWSPPRALSPEGVPAGFPRVVSTEEGFRVFWTSEQPNQAATWTSVPFVP
ncbi:MAG: hypothetical protein RLZZ142_700 [Verrucomicrobiota bacterium]|jgi:hypothetical protein